MEKRGLARGSTLYREDPGVVKAAIVSGLEGVSAELIDEARRAAPDRPWGHLIRFADLEPRLSALGTSLLARAPERGVAHLSIRAGFDGDALPERLQGFWNLPRMPFPEGASADAVAAAAGAAALTWKAMTGRSPEGMRGWIAVAREQGAGRAPHFDNDDGSVVITLAGQTTWIASPADGSILSARALVPLAVPGRNASGIGGMLHGVSEAPMRVVAVFRSSMSGRSGARPAKNVRDIEFDRDAVADLLGVPGSARAFRR